MEHANVVVLTQSNKKQGAARNYGLSKAQGEYIWFVDSDDWIEANCLGRLLALCDDNGIEVLAIDRINTDGKSFQEKLRNTPADKIFSGLDFFKVLDNNLAICLYLWRRELLLQHKLRFVEGVVHEDTEFIPRALFYAKSVLYSRQPVYYVYCRPGSTTRKASLQRCLDLITVAERLIIFCKEHNEVASYINRIVGDCICTAVRLSDSLSVSERKVFYARISAYKVSFCNVLYHRGGCKNRIEGFLFYMNPRLYNRIDRWVGRIKKR